jgi:hypothetical protein
LRLRPDLDIPTLPEPGAAKPIVVNIGVTGHRAGVLTAPLVRSLRPVVYTVFRELREATLRLQGSEPVFCSSTEARLRLHTPLATGADQIAAICARSSGYFVRAVLPFEPSEYRKDFADGEELDGFEQALAAADEIVALPGDRSDLEGAYVLVGESLVGTADVVIAIWDGEQGRGPGGTAHVVELAIRNSVPVIHIDIDRGSDKVRMRALIDGDAARPFRTSLRDPELYSRVLRGALKLDPAPAVDRGGAFETAEVRSGRRS